MSVDTTAAGHRSTALATTHPTARHRWGGWLPLSLLALVVVPAVAGSLRLVEIAGGPRLLPANPRLTAAPIPVVVHIVCAVAYAVLGAFQFSAAFRRRRPGWHRVAGRLVVVLGLAVATSALWLTVAYARQPGTGSLTHGLRLAAGSAMAVSLVLGVVAVRRGQVARHRAWMTRAYALALGAGTQVFTLGVGIPLLGNGVRATDFLRAAAWVINLLAAEVVIARRGRGRSRTAGVAVRSRSS